MEAAMGVSKGRKGPRPPLSGPNMSNGVDQAGFIDINYETPINQQSQQPYSQQPQPLPNSYPEMNGYPPHGYPVRGHPQYPPMPKQGIPPSQGANMYMNSNGSSVSTYSQMYHNPSAAASGMSFGGNTGGVGSAGPYGRTPYGSSANNRPRAQRRNSNSSISTKSVNNFVKKQWNRFGNKGSAASIKDEEEDDGGIEVDTSQNEISFDDLAHMRGDTLGSFNLKDSTPYIPTLKVSMNPSKKMTGEQYRKIQMANKKNKAVSLTRHQELMQAQFKQQQQEQSQQFPANGPPRAMSLQRNPNGYLRGPPPPNMPHLPYPPNPGMPPQGLPHGYGYSPMGPYLGPPQGYPPVPQQYGYPPVGPRSMSMQSQNTMQRGYPGPLFNPQNQPPIPTSETTNMPRSFSNQSGPGGIRSQTNNNLENAKEAENKPRVPVEEKKPKKVTKIDFSTFSDDDDDSHGVNDTTTLTSANVKDSNKREINENNSSKGVVYSEEDPEEEDQFDPKHESPVKGHSRRADGRAGADSVVTFESFNASEQKANQNALYGTTNSTQQTVFYSASEFPTSDDNQQRNKIKQLKNNSSKLNLSEINDEIDDVTQRLSDFPGDETKVHDKSNRDSVATSKSTQPLHFDNEPAGKSISNELQQQHQHKPLLSPSPVSTVGLNKNMVDMSLKLKSQESLQGKTVKDNKTNHNQLFPIPSRTNLITPPSSASLLLDGRSAKSKSADFDPQTPVSTYSIPTSAFTAEQFGLLNDNQSLLQELELVTTELASSVSREIQLEDTLRRGGSKVDVNISQEFKLDHVIIDDDKVEIKPEAYRNSREYAKTLTALAKQLNDERKKRYTIEEMLLQYQESSNLPDTQRQLLYEEKQNVRQLNDRVNDLLENEKLYRSDKELLETENEALKFELEEVKRKYKNIENQVIPQMQDRLNFLEAFYEQQNLNM
ncbi:unnamed protein product [Pichia kudriavzevii]